MPLSPPMVMSLPALLPPSTRSSSQLLAPQVDSRTLVAGGLRHGGQRAVFQREVFIERQVELFELRDLRIEFRFPHRSRALGVVSTRWCRWRPTANRCRQLQIAAGQFHAAAGQLDARLRLSDRPPCR